MKKIFDCLTKKMSQEEKIVMEKKCDNKLSVLRNSDKNSDIKL